MFFFRTYLFADQRLLGMSMHTERSTLGDVKKKLASLKRKQRDPVQEAEELFKKQKIENEKRKLDLKMKKKGHGIPPPPPPEKKKEEKRMHYLIYWFSPFICLFQVSFF